MRIALAQHAPSPSDLEANLRRARQLMVEAAARGAELFALPELWLTGYELEAIAATPRLSLGPDDARLDELRRTCQELGLTAILGAPWRAAAADDGDARPLLAAPILHPDGSLHVSAKWHLHGRERDVFRAAPPAPPFELRGWRVSVAICFDVANPPHAAAAAAAGADLYIGSALYDASEVRRSDLHFGARAMDHRMFSALANYAGTSGGLVSCGRSGVWRPSGELQCRAGIEEITVVADLDRAEVEAYRRA
jgi:5-aminopentanamidase